MQAAFLKIRLENYDQDVARRREIAARYHDVLVVLVHCTPAPPTEDGDYFDVYQNYELAAEDRDALEIT